jgi:hypothetical protein
MPNKLLKEIKKANNGEVEGVRKGYIDGIHSQPHPCDIKGKEKFLKIVPYTRTTRGK